MHALALVSGGTKPQGLGYFYPSFSSWWDVIQVFITRCREKADGRSTEAFKIMKYWIFDYIVEVCGVTRSTASGLFFKVFEE